MNNLQTQDWYNALVDDCKAIVTEAVFVSRWALVEGYWSLGKRIREDEQSTKFSKGITRFIDDLAKSIGVKKSTIYYALQFFDKYPVLEEIPEGKSITWNKLITIYLPKFIQTQDRAEQIFENFAEKNGVELQRGLPDYMIIKNGEVAGFVEVKRDALSDELRNNQLLFMKFCKKNNIPYQVWSPVMANKKFNESKNKEYKNRMRYSEEDVWKKV